MDDSSTVLAPNQLFGRTIYLPLFCTDDAYDCVTGRSSDNKPDFDSAFAIAHSVFDNQLDVAAATGNFDFFKGKYQFAIWRGSHAVLALIQDDFDIQFGFEITVWIIECASTEPPPNLPPHN